MNTLDLVILVLVGIFLVRGLIKGFLKEVASLVGVFLGIFLGFRAQPILTHLGQRLGLTPSWALSLGAFLLVFLGVIIAVKVLAWAISKAFSTGTLGFGNRLLGAGLALLKALIIVCIGVTILGLLAPKDSGLIQDSKLAPYVQKLTKSALNLISPGIYDGWKERFKEHSSKSTGERLLGHTTI